MDKPTALPDLKSAIEIHEGSSYEPGPKTGDYLFKDGGSLRVNTSDRFLGWIAP